MDAWDENNMDAWERTRALAYVVALYGNSDHRKLRSPQSIWKFPWDKKIKNTSAAEIMRQHAEMKAMREAIEKSNAGKRRNSNNP